jgi:DNA-binding XRE family transcriptional regulator
LPEDRPIFKKREIETATFFKIITAFGQPVDGEQQMTLNNKFRRLFGQRIRQIRLACNYSQQAVAEEVGVSAPTLSSWENGTRPPTLDSIHKLAKVYQVQPKELFPTLN